MFLCVQKSTFSTVLQYLLIISWDSGLKYGVGRGRRKDQGRGRRAREEGEEEGEGREREERGEGDGRNPTKIKAHTFSLLF